MTPLDYLHAGFSTSRLALGCMHFGGTWGADPVTPEAHAAARTATEIAYAAGVRFFDHADIYCGGKSESVFPLLLKELGIDRRDLIIQTKCGIRFPHDPSPDAPHRFDFSKEHILNSVERSLQRLQTDYVDILLLHRPDLLCEPEEVAEAFDILHAAGKVRHFGVSNHVPAQLELLRAAVRQPIVANQIEFSLLRTALLDCSVVADGRSPMTGRAADGTLDYHRLHGIVTQAWAPLAYGYVSGRPAGPEWPTAMQTQAAVMKIAASRGVPPEAVVIAWILRHPARIQPVIGTRDPERLRACLESDRIQLTREEWYTLYLAGRGRALP